MIRCSGERSLNAAAGISIPLVALALVASGCGGSSTPTVDSAKIEPELVNNLARNAGVSPTGVKMSCPSGEPATKGTRFRCKLTAADGSTANVRVTVTSVTTANGRIHYQVHGVVPKGQFK